MCTRTLANLVLASSLAALASPAIAQHCSMQPPPEGLVPRCQKLDILVPSSRLEFELLLLHWMESCAVRSRGAQLVIGNDSVDSAWALIEDKRYTPYSSVRILPRYTPNQYQSEGRTCYGVGAVRFAVAGTESEVEFGEPEVVPGTTLGAFTDEQIRAAATAGERALYSHPGPDANERSRMQNILARMKSYGSDFNDLYYRLAPDDDILGNLNPPACFKEADPGGPLRCSASDKARENCQRFLGPQLVQLHLSGASDEELASRLLVLANDIGRAKRYLVGIQAADSPGAVPCRTISDTFMPEIGSLANDPRTLYNAWDAGP